MFPIGRLFLAVALCLSLLSPLTSAQSKEKASPEPDVPMREWLAGPDHTDIPAEFRCLSPRLTFQQRFLVECRAAISGEVARGRRIHYWVRVADHTGEWLAGKVHNASIAAPNLTRRNEVQFVSGFYANPGQYTAAIIIFDADSRQYDVRHIPFTVKPIDNDPLASHLESASPAVEFLAETPPATQSFVKIGDVDRDSPDSLWPFARTLDSFPMNSTRPIQLDVVLNLSDIGEAFEIPQIIPRIRRSATFDPRMLPPPPRPINAQQHQREYIGAALGIARLFAAIHPSNGCVRVSAFDISNMDVPVRRVPPESVEWERLRDDRTSSKLAEVSVNALKNRKEQPVFVRDFLSTLQSPIENCGTGADPMHAVIVVSHPYVFTNGAHKPSFKFPDNPSLRNYYYLLRTGSERVFDDLGGYLKSAGAKTHDIYSPRDLREPMARTLNDLVQPKK